MHCALKEIPKGQKYPCSRLGKNSGSLSVLRYFSRKLSVFKIEITKETDFTIKKCKTFAEKNNNVHCGTVSRSKLALQPSIWKLNPKICQC